MIIVLIADKIILPSNIDTLSLLEYVQIKACQQIKYLFMILKNSRYLILLVLSIGALTSCSYKRDVTARNIVLDVHYSSNMVFKDGDSLQISGYADPNGTLAIKINTGLKLIDSDEDGRWVARFPPIDYKGPFSIIIEGEKQQIELENVIMGKVWVVFGDTWIRDTPENIFKKNTTSYHGSNELVRVYTPESLFNKNENSNPGWEELNTKRKEKRELFAGLLGDALANMYNEPVGIINLAYPGTDMQDFVQDNFGLSSEVRDSIWNEYFNLQERYNRLADSSFRGLERDVLDRLYDDWEWSDVSFPLVTRQSWFLRNRIVWLRKKIFVASKFITSDFTLELGTLRGQYDFYFNGNHLDRFTGESRNYTLQIPDSLVKVWTNLITVRFVAGDSLSGLYNENPRIHNADSSYMQTINEDWVIRTYYEPMLPKVKRNPTVMPEVYEIYLKPLTGLSVNGMVLTGSEHQYLNTEVNTLSEALRIIHSSIEAEQRYMFLQTKPSFIEDRYNGRLYNSIRNAQLEAAVKNKWNIVNSIDVETEDMTLLHRSMVNRLIEKLR